MPVLRASGSVKSLTWPILVPGEWSEVRSGLHAGEKVVTNGAFYVKSALLKEQLGGGE